VLHLVSREERPLGIGYGIHPSEPRLNEIIAGGRDVDEGCHLNIGRALAARIFDPITEVEQCVSAAHWEA